MSSMIPYFPPSIQAYDPTQDDRGLGHGSQAPSLLKIRSS
jgi:hypothetical protein